MTPKERAKERHTSRHPSSGGGASRGTFREGAGAATRLPFISRWHTDGSAATARAARAGKSTLLSTEKSDVIRAWVRSGEVRWTTDEERRRAKLAEKWRRHHVRAALQKAKAEGDWEEEREEGAPWECSNGPASSSGNAFRRFHTDYGLKPTGLAMEELPGNNGSAFPAPPSCLPEGPDSIPGSLNCNGSGLHPSKSADDATKDCWYAKGSGSGSPALEEGLGRALDGAPSSATDLLGSSGDSGEMDRESGPLAYPWPHSGELGTAGESAVVAEEKQGSVTGAGKGGGRDGSKGRGGGNGLQNRESGGATEGWDGGGEAAGATRGTAIGGLSRAQSMHLRAVEERLGVEEAPWELPKREAKSSPCRRPTTALVQSVRPFGAASRTSHGTRWQRPLGGSQPGILSQPAWLELFRGRPRTSNGRTMPREERYETQKKGQTKKQGVCHERKQARPASAQRDRQGQGAGKTGNATVVNKVHTRYSARMEPVSRSLLADERRRTGWQRAWSLGRWTDGEGDGVAKELERAHGVSTAEPGPHHQLKRSFTTQSVDMEGPCRGTHQGLPIQGCGVPNGGQEDTWKLPPPTQGAPWKPQVWWLGAYFGTPKAAKGQAEGRGSTAAAKPATGSRPGAGWAWSVRSTATSDAGDPLWRSGPLVRETCAQRDRELLGIIPHCRSWRGTLGGVEEWLEAEQGAEETAAVTVMSGTEPSRTSRSLARGNGHETEAWAGVEKRAEKEKLKSAEMRRAALRRVHTTQAMCREEM